MTDAQETTPDETLAARAAEGDHSSFDILVRRYKQPLFRFVRRYVGQADDAYDILQDSFIAAWTALHRYDPKRPFGPWLRTIALNKCRDFGRRAAVRRALLRLVTFEAGVPDVSETERLEDEDRLSTRLAHLDMAVSLLPAIYKEPLLLTAIEGLSHEETAKILKTTRKAVEMRLYRARQRLAEEIGKKSAG